MRTGAPTTRRSSRACRSEEHTSELQSRENLVCRLVLEKKKALARRLEVPYPALLALAGAVLAFLPIASEIEIDPDLVLALFVAPVLVDAFFFNDTATTEIYTLSLHDALPI